MKKGFNLESFNIQKRINKQIGVIYNIGKNLEYQHSSSGKHYDTKIDDNYRIYVRFSIPTEEGAPIELI